ncbi:MAG: ornithine carbamoyltransferase [Hydrotalea sp.]|nr:ornithine carbamoyltransferase [Hydrotalea sp.]
MTQKTTKHFLDIIDLDRATLLRLVDVARAMKQAVQQQKSPSTHNYAHKTLVGIFDKPSTRTRISFYMAMNYLGGKFMSITGGEMQLGHGESLSDTAQVLSVLADGMMIRTYHHQTLKTLAQHATIPVINGLTDDSHPCQIVAGLLTILEEFGGFDDVSLAWVGDGNNTCQSWVEAAAVLGLPMVVAAPKQYAPNNLPKNIALTDQPAEAIKGKKVIITDTWVSMNHSDRAARLEKFKGFTIDEAMMATADKSAIFSHCLPAHRGEEVTAGVIDGRQSRVLREAENRIYAQMAIVDMLFFA